MPDKINKGQIFATLADKLPDNILRELFPESSITAIRQFFKAEAKQAGLQDDLTINDRGTGSSADHQARRTQTSLFGTATDTCSLYTDGASRGNPGEAGAGVVLLDGNGMELLANSFYLGKCTNNAAEYQALIAGLKNALEAGCKTLHIFLDSELVVRQVEGRYKVKNAQLKPLYEEVKRLLARLVSWQIRHVPREQNSRADELANRGIDDKS